MTSSASAAFLNFSILFYLKFNLRNRITRISRADDFFLDFLSDKSWHKKEEDKEQYSSRKSNSEKVEEFLITTK